VLKTGRFEDGGLALSLEDRLRFFDAIMDRVSEYTVRRIRLADKRGAAVLFLNGRQDHLRLEQDVIMPLVANPETLGRMPETFSFQVTSTVSMREASDAILRGDVVLTVEHEPQAWILSLRRHPGRDVDPATSERAVLGPKESFVESLLINTSLVRTRLATEKLKSERVTVGSISRTPVAILYLDGTADKSLVRRVKAMVAGADLPVLNHVSELFRYIADKRWSPFPQVKYTERPDVTVGHLLEGRVALLADGSPEALIAPITLGGLFQSPEDSYLQPAIATAIRLLRVLAFIITTTALPVYVAMVSYHYDMLPLNFVLNLARTRLLVPFEPLTEALFLDVAVELLREGAVRLPAGLGQTLTIAATLIIGQAILQAQVVSPMLLVTVGFTTVASFAIPDYSSFIGIRLLRFPLMLAAGFL
jgi:hypothetical protein